MAKLPKLYYSLIFVMLVAALTGCELRRDSDDASNPRPVGDLPTLAPLGAESAELAGDATAVPTVINVEPTATASVLEEGQAAEDPNEPVVPTSQPPSIEPEAAAENSEIEEAVVEPETFTPPAEEPAIEEPIVVDAPTEDLPAGGPIAANPPSSQTTGDYAAPTFDETSYVVQSGDTLFSIGQRHGTSAQAIVLANGLPSDLIYAGQELIIPADDGSFTPPVAFNEAAPAVPAAPAAGGEVTFHVVAPGETLFRIALTYNTSVDAIAGANGIPFPYIIQAGQELVIPPFGSNPGPPPPPAEGFFQPEPGFAPPPGPGNSAPSAAPPPGPGFGAEGSFGPPNGAPTHTVAPGETLYSISLRYGTSAQAIAGANGLTDPNQIFVGQVLYLP